jgi:hypothetical protein
LRPYENIGENSPHGRKIGLCAAALFADPSRGHGSIDGVRLSAAAGIGTSRHGRIAATYVVFTVDSAIQHWRGQGGMWKGRIQAIR